MKQELPEGWDEARIKRIIDHYERAASGHLMVSDASWQKRSDLTLIEVPKELLPAIRQLLAAHAREKPKRRSA